MVALFPSIKDRPKLGPPAGSVLSPSTIHPFVHISCNFNSLRLWLVTEVTVNAGIVSALLWEFRKARGILTDTKGCAIWQILYHLHGSYHQHTQSADRGNNPEWRCGGNAGRGGSNFVSRTNYSRSSIEHTGSRSRYYVAPESNRLLFELYYHCALAHFSGSRRDFLVPAWTRLCHHFGPHFLPHIGLGRS
jgi:hypothetical protein